MSSSGSTHQLRSLLRSAIRWPARRPARPVGRANWLRQPDEWFVVGTWIAGVDASAFFMSPLPGEYARAAQWVRAFYVCKQPPTVAEFAHPETSLLIGYAFARIGLYHISIGCLK